MTEITLQAVVEAWTTNFARLVKYAVLEEALKMAKISSDEYTTITQELKEGKWPTISDTQALIIVAFMNQRDIPPYPWENTDDLSPAHLTRKRYKFFKFLSNNGLSVVMTERRYCSSSGTPFALICYKSDQEEITEVIDRLTGGDEEGVGTESFLFYSGYPAITVGPDTPDPYMALYDYIQQTIAEVGMSGWNYGVWHSLAKAATVNPMMISEIDFKAIVAEGA